MMNSLHAQHTNGRWGLSAHVLANSWFNDYNQRIVGVGGDLQARYGVSRRFSIGGEFALERLKTGQDPIRLDIPHPYLKLNSRSLTLLAWVHLLPGNAVAPYVFGGVGMMWYSRATHLAYFPDPGVRHSVRFPIGVGVETFSMKALSYDFNISYAVLDDQTDAHRYGGSDGSLAVRFGMNFYLGSSSDEDEDGDGLTTAEEERVGTNPTNPDTDEDGLSDGAEIRRYKTDPLHPDSDGDRLKDGEEVQRYGTDPIKADTDGDGIIDGDEILAGKDPLDPDSHP